MHRAALEFFGLDGTYELIDVEPAQLEARVVDLMNKGFCGFNVTIPHKDSMFKLAHSHTGQANAAKAANTIKIVENSFMGVELTPKTKLLAHNTDIEGFKLALTSHFELRDPNKRSACVLGAGGASRAAIVALAALGFQQICIVARDQGKAQMMLEAISVDRSKCQILPLSAAMDERFDLLVNTTPLGQQNAELPGWVSFLLEQADGSEYQFFDMVYSRSDKPTALVELARNRGWKAVDGKDMLIHQARAAFEFWTGKMPPFEVMSDAFLSNLKV